MTVPRGRPQNPRPPGIVQVAREAGVSTATVSRVVNGARYVRSETRERVLEVAGRLRYQPNVTARSLTTGRTLLVGVVVSDIEIPFFTTIAHAIQSAARDRGYLTLVGNSDEHEQSEDDLVRAFAARMVDGLIVSPTPGGNQALRDLAELIPVVVVDRFVDGLQADAVLSDNVLGASEAAAHLLGLGHRRIAYATDALDKTSSCERLEGFLRAFTEAGVVHDPDLVWVVDYHTAAAEKAVGRLLRRHRPTALVASEGSITLGSLRAAHSLRFRIPSDLSLVGFDQLDWGSATEPPITVVSQDAERIGTIATRLLLRQLRSAGKRASRKHIVERVPTRLIVRRSSAPPGESG